MNTDLLGDQRMTESELQDLVIEMARALAYRVAHFRPALTKHGWRTPVAADGKGFPDLLLCHLRTGAIVVCELKSDRGKLDAEQETWLETFRKSAAHVYVFRPQDWLDGSVERALLLHANVRVAA